MRSRSTLTMFTINPIFKVVTLLFFCTMISAFQTTTTNNINFQNYCWPILGDGDTTLIYKYEMYSLDYGKKWNRYFEIKSFNENEIKYFEYKIYTTDFQLESHYKYQLDHLGIKLKAMETYCSSKSYLEGKVKQNRVFEWNLEKGKTCSSSMIFDNYENDEDMTVISNSKFEGSSGKIHYHNEKLPTIKFERNVIRQVNGKQTETKGVSVYAKGIGYYGSHIVLNESIEFDEVLVDILSEAKWQSLQNEKFSPTDKPED